jgi:plastocyanin domain-containing protein
MMKKLLIVSILVFIGLTELPVTAQPRTQNITVSLTRRGYEPSSIRLRRGVRTQLTFIRKTDDDCGQQLVIPAYNIKRDLPLNRPVTVIFTPRRSGTFGFSCGMDMLHGTLVVS